MLDVWTEADCIRSLSVQGMPPPYEAEFRIVKAIIFAENFFIACGNHRAQGYNEIKVCVRCGKEICRTILKPDPGTYFTTNTYCGPCQKKFGIGYVGIVPPGFSWRESYKEKIPLEYIVAEFLLNSEAYV